MDKIGWVINGPNLNMLGERSEEHYGCMTYQTLCDELREYAGKRGMVLNFFQSNHEGEIVEKLHTLVHERCDFLIINMGAFTHYSIAIYDALEMQRVPIIEVHLSNIFAREAFRSHSLFAKLCVGQITGFKEHSYFLAVDYFNRMGEIDALY